MYERTKKHTRTPTNACENMSWIFPYLLFCRSRSRSYDRYRRSRDRSRSPWARGCDEGMTFSFRLAAFTHLVTVLLPNIEQHESWSSLPCFINRVKCPHLSHTVLPCIPLSRPKDIHGFLFGSLFLFHSFAIFILHHIQLGYIKRNWKHRENDAKTDAMLPVLDNKRRSKKRSYKD